MFGVAGFSVVLVLFGVLSEIQANCPNGIRRKGVSSQDKSLIVDVHNAFRKKIANGQVKGQPRGTNLKRMSWDDCLAAEAQRIANSCEFAHQTATCKAWSWVGQNLYTTFTTDSNNRNTEWQSAIDSWINEHKIYRFGSGFSMQTGHYTQVVWADTYKVGCGFTYFEGNGIYRYQKLYVCNYGPGGNYNGQNPYQVGRKGCENLC